MENCGQYCVALTGGGEYDFNHSTIANFWSYDVRQKPAFILTNTFRDVNGATQVREVESSLFRNGIIYGNNANEIQLSFDNQLSPAYTFTYFLFRSADQTTMDPGHFELNTIFRNQSPGFVDENNGDFHLTENAYARNKGLDDFGADPEAFNDLDNKVRAWDGAPDLGCYEYPDQ